MDDELVTHRGSCHCGSVQFEVDAAESLELEMCNCSICTMSGIVHLCVPNQRFRITDGEDNLTSYRFGSGVASHPFCSTCGIKGFYYPRAFPDGVSVNANCLDRRTIKHTEVVRHFNGIDWEGTMQAEGYSPPGGSKST